MMPHIIFIIIIILCLPQLNKRYPIWLFGLFVLFGFSALRYNYGPDYLSYQNIYQNINIGGEKTDVLFRVLNLLFSDFYLMIAFISCFYIVVIWFLIKNNLKKSQYWIAIAILLFNPYLFLTHLSSLRQTIAISFFIIAVYFAIEKKPIKYCFLIILASGFHGSAIVLLPVYFFLNDRKINRKEIIFIFVCGLILFATPLFTQILTKALAYFPMNYTIYYESAQQNSLRSTLIGSVYFFFVLLNCNKLRGRELIYAKLSIISTLIALLGYKVSMLMRLGMYFDIFLIISIPQIFDKIDNKLSKVVWSMLLITIYALRYYSFFHSEWAIFYNTYHTIFSIK